MKKHTRIFSVAFLTVLLSLFFMMPSLAYLEPATVSVLWAAIAGAVIGASVTIGVYWKKIRMFFSNLKMKRLEKKLKNQADKKK